MERRDAVQIRFHGKGFIAGEQGKVGDAIGHPAVANSFQSSDFGVVRCDDQLPAAPVCDAALFAVPVEPLAPGDAQPGLQ